MKCVGWKCSFSFILVLGALLLTVAPLLAQQTPASSAAPLTIVASAATSEIPRAVNEKLAQLDKDVKAAQSSADNAWMLVSAALVLMMTGPGLALFYGGLVRRKNTLAIMMQSFALMALITVMWALVGYSLCFGGDGHFIGSFEHAFLRGVGADPNPDYAGTIPQLTFMVYQLMFAIITPALITGATAERMKFSGTVLFLALWFLAVYAPLAHMVWGKGGFLNASLGGKFPTLDFAGGTVVHISSGVSALVCALYLGKRTGYPKQPMPPHSLVLSFIGACLLWVGWFGFNAGSALASNSLATSAFVATHFAAAAAALSWSAAEWFKNGRASALGAISGAVAGLVAITPAAGFVGPMPALAIGLIAGVVCYWMVTKVKAIFGYDDALDAFGVHGAGGTIGALLTGVFAQQVINPIFGAGKAVGALDGHWGQVGNQLMGVLIAWVFALVGTLVLLKIVDLLTGIRVPEEHEIEGLDITQHGEEAYNLES
ncbi:MAG: ammonia channel protein [Acidobacteria bacterium]|nr:MAG: ammonia channel protein [Acidobacteriota bacterium]PYU71935.1 MAG: ammonia channel protein [Acidobacteriota bacterium]